MPNQNIQVLLVEDSPTDAMIVQEELTHIAGIQFVVTQVDRLAEAVRRLDEGRFEVVLLDLGLPDSDGFETFVRLRAAAADIPIVVLSGRADETLAVKAVQAGAQDYLMKGHLEEHVLSRSIRYAIERKQAEKALRLLSSAVEQSGESVLITDAQINEPGPRIVFVNPAFTAMTGYTSAEVLGKTPRILQGPRTDKAVLRRLRLYLEAGRTFFGEAINYRKDGHEFHLEWQIAPIRDAGGRITHFLATQRDITTRKQAEADLAATHRELLDTSRRIGMAEVATGLLHDVNNVLTSVSLETGLLAVVLRESHWGGLAPVVALLREHESDLAAFFTLDPRGKQVLDFLTLLAGQLTDDQATALASLTRLEGHIEHVNSVVKTQQHSAISGGKDFFTAVELLEAAVILSASGRGHDAIQFVREYQELPPILVEKHKVIQILVNLLRNAIQACEESSRSEKRLTLRIRPAGHHAQISVSDNGGGISPENLAHIFTRGFTTKKAGHGFGLSGGFRAAREMGGALLAQSEGLDQGATFTLELPLPAKDNTEWLDPNRSGKGDAG